VAFTTKGRPGKGDYLGGLLHRAAEQLRFRAIRALKTLFFQTRTGTGLCYGLSNLTAKGPYQGISQSVLLPLIYPNTTGGLGGIHFLQTPQKPVFGTASRPRGHNFTPLINRHIWVFYARDRAPQRAQQHFFHPFWGSHKLSRCGRYLGPLLWGPLQGREFPLREPLPFTGDIQFNPQTVSRTFQRLSQN